MHGQQVTHQIKMTRIVSVEGEPQEVEDEAPELSLGGPPPRKPDVLPENPTFDDLVRAVRSLQSKP